MSLMAAKKGPPDLAIILGHKPEHDSEDEGEPKEHGEPKLDAMEAFIKAVKDGDAEAASEAFDTLHDLRAADEDDDGGDKDEGEEDEG